MVWFGTLGIKGKKHKVPACWFGSFWILTHPPAPTILLVFNISISIIILIIIILIIIIIWHHITEINSTIYSLVPKFTELNIH